jgi:ABC-2 type transport system ATP-binding protein
MLKITGLTKSYKNYQVLNGLDMRVDKGDVYGFLGTNGCGKTTTMNIICNIIHKDGGEVAFENEKVKIGYLPETPTLYGYMNGFEYLDYIAACCDYEGDIKARTAEVLDITGMTGSADRRIKTYSRGMNQRVGIAAALYAHPDLLILDEPTSALDPEGRAEVMDIISKLAAVGSTIILCTHILTDVERVANKIGILRGGVMEVEGELNEVQRRYAGRTALSVRLKRHSPEAVDALKKVTFAEKVDGYPSGEIILYAKEGIAEGDVFYKTIAALAEKRILPECVEFRHLTLEQIYIGVVNGTLKPV